MEKRLLVSYCEMNDEWREYIPAALLMNEVVWQAVDGNLESKDSEEGSRKRKTSLMLRGREMVF
jgi:hypothetical protein